MSNLIINGSNFPDGGGIPINGVQAERIDVIQGGNPAVTVWRNTQVPSAITDFTASDGLADKIQFTWTNASGIPDPTYNVMEGTTVLAADVPTGYIHDVAGPYNGVYHVIAVNTAGQTASNTDNGGSLTESYDFFELYDTSIENNTTSNNIYVLSAGIDGFKYNGANSSGTIVFDMFNNRFEVGTTILFLDAFGGDQGVECFETNKFRCYAPSQTVTGEVIYDPNTLTFSGSSTDGFEHQLITSGGKFIAQVHVSFNTPVLYMGVKRTSKTTAMTPYGMSISSSSTTVMALLSNGAGIQSLTTLGGSYFKSPVCNISPEGLFTPGQYTDGNLYPAGFNVAADGVSFSLLISTIGGSFYPVTGACVFDPVSETFSGTSTVDDIAGYSLYPGPNGGIIIEAVGTSTYGPGQELMVNSIETFPVPFNAIWSGSSNYVNGNFESKFETSGSTFRRYSKSNASIYDTGWADVLPDRTFVSSSNCGVYGSLALCGTDNSINYGSVWIGGSADYGTISITTSGPIEFSFVKGPDETDLSPIDLNYVWVYGGAPISGNPAVEVSGGQLRSLWSGSTQEFGEWITLT